jgi:hypothetical protein
VIYRNSLHAQISRYSNVPKKIDGSEHFLPALVNITVMGDTRFLYGGGGEVRRHSAYRFTLEPFENIFEACPRIVDSYIE